MNKNEIVSVRFSMRGRLVATAVIAIAVCLVAAIAWFGYGQERRLRALEATLDARWAEVEPLCQRRVEVSRNLIPILTPAENVDKQLLTSLSQAQAGVEESPVDAKRAPREAGQFGAFQQSQKTLNQAIASALIALSRNPQLKADPKVRSVTVEFLMLGKELAVHEQRFVQAGLAYNEALRPRPASIYAPVLGFRPRPYFEETNGMPALAFGFW